MEPFETVTTVRDRGTADFLRDALVTAGLEPIEIRAVTGLPYLARATALEFEVRVLSSAAAHARAVVAALGTDGEALALRESLSARPPADLPQAPRGPRLNVALALSAALVALALFYCLLR
jgi:hypothetical protein